VKQVSGVKQVSATVFAIASGKRGKEKPLQQP
jgi:hypothetical protein